MKYIAVHTVSVHHSYTTISSKEAFLQDLPANNSRNYYYYKIFKKCFHFTAYIMIQLVEG